MGTNRGTSGTGSGGGSSTPHIWLSADQACELFGIKSRALRKRVSAGKVERRKVGNRSLYREAETTEAPAAPGTETEALAAPVRHLRPLGSLAAAPEAVPQGDPAPQSATLLGLVAQLTADLARASAERGEAIGVGFMLAEQRDRAEAERNRLAAQLAELQRALFNLSDTARAWPVRKQLLTALVRSTPLTDTQDLPE